MAEEDGVKSNFNESDGWIQIPDMDSFWCPSDNGDTLQGIYTKKEENIGRNHAEVYTLKQGDVEYKIFGTVGLIRKMEEIPIGYEVGIVYKGEKPSTPPKKPFKLFDIYKRQLDSKDGFKTEISTNNRSTIPEKSEMADGDDPEAQNTINNYEEIFKENNHDIKPETTDIIHLAETDPELNEMELSRIKAQLARNIKR